MTASLTGPGPLYVSWADQDPAVVHVRVFGDGGVLFNGPTDSLAVGVSGEESADREGLLPIRWSPQPLSLLAWRLRHSDAAADLKQAGWIVGLLLAALFVLIGGEWLQALASGNVQ